MFVGDMYSRRNMDVKMICVLMFLCLDLVLGQGKCNCKICMKFEFRKRIYSSNGSLHVGYIAQYSHKVFDFCHKPFDICGLTYYFSIMINRQKSDIKTVANVA